MGRDITDWSTVPTLTLPASAGRVMTAEECEAAASRDEDRLAACIDPETRRWLRSEIDGWHRLAAERSAPCA